MNVWLFVRFVACPTVVVSHRVAGLFDCEVLVFVACRNNNIDHAYDACMYAYVCMYVGMYVLF